MIENELTLVFDYESVDENRVWELIASHLEECGLAETTYEITDVVVPFYQVGRVLKQRGNPYFGIKGELFEFDLTVVGTYRHDAIRISGASRVEWDKWVSQLQVAGSFVQAFLVDRKYDFWQNAEDPLQYQARNRSCEGLPMKSNGLPFPLEQEVVDTSGNPGRRVLHEGFIEAVGSPMWFGNRFWDLTGGSKNAAANEGFEVEEENGIARISIGAPITDLTDRSRQETLRRILFPQCCSA